MNEKAYDNLIMKIMHDESIFYSFMLNSAMSKGFSSLTMLHSGLHSIIYTVNYWKNYKNDFFWVNIPKIAKWR